MESHPRQPANPARHYVAASGALFALLLLAHLARAAMEGAQVFGDIVFAISTLVALGFCAWAWRTWRALR